MRVAFTAVLVVAAVDVATACPSQQISTDDAPTTASPCLTSIDWASVRRLLELRYAVGAGGTSRSGIGSVANAFASIELAYALQFGRDEAQPTYEIELTGGVTGQRFAGAVDASGLVTQAALHLGPAKMAASIETGRSNIATFPFTLELAHVGELNARPRISARPELARSLYGRERVEFATRAVRIEGAGNKSDVKAPGQTPVKKPTSWAFDAISLHAGVDIAMQDATRFETTVGGSMIGVVEHSSGAKIDLLGVDYRYMDLPMTGPTSLITLWALRLEGVDPKTGTRYTMGWGEVFVPDLDSQQGAFAYKINSEGRLRIGGFGWFSNRSWGGFGAQYKREPYVAMTGDLALEDRVSGEIYFPRALNLVARVFGAHTQRLVADELVSDVTAGVELDTSYAGHGWASTLSLELGRTFYTALDDTLPMDTGFVAAVGLSVQHTGAHAWRR